MRTMSKNGREERGWNGEHLLSTGRRAPSLTHRIRRTLGEVLQELTPLERQGKVKGFFNNTENAALLGGLVEGIRDAMMEYQVRALNFPSRLV